MTVSDIFALVSVLISIGAFTYTYLTNTKKYELFNQYRNEVLCWFSDTSDILIRLKLESLQDFPNGELRRDLLSKLSSKIEKGRFYFPNIYNSYGQDKLPAYRGYRNVILDFLVFSYRLFEKDDAKLFLSHAEMLQKYFTSSIYEVIDPKKFLKETEKHTERILSRELSFEHYIEAQPDLIKTYIKDYNI